MTRNARLIIRLLRKSNCQCRSGNRLWKSPKSHGKKFKRLLLMRHLVKRMKTALLSTDCLRNFAMATPWGVEQGVLGVAQRTDR